MKSNRWALFGKIALILGVIVAVIEIYDRIKESGPNIIVEVKSQPFNIPEEILNKIENTGFDKNFSKDFFRSSIAPDIFLIYLKITNEGENTATNVSLKMPYVPESILIRSNGQYKGIESKLFVDFGNIKPKEEIEAFIWQSFPLSIISSEFKLQYEGGSGKFYYYKTYRGFLGLIIKVLEFSPFSFIFFFIICISLVFIGLVFGIDSKQKKLKSIKSKKKTEIKTLGNTKGEA
ncbi:MAG: hypothetical protein MUO31_09895 [Thermodesulfovibrionales bacterium]|nr:hypothetical protein [Thermodesulfovibrionales bacterium]